MLKFHSLFVVFCPFSDCYPSFKSVVPDDEMRRRLQYPQIDKNGEI